MIIKKRDVLLKHKKSRKGRNSYGNISLTNKPPTNSKIFLNSSGTTDNTTNNTLSSHNIFKKVHNMSQCILVSSFHEMKVPVAEPSFPFSEKHNKEHLMVNKYKKLKGNKFGIVKIYDKYNKINNNNIKNHYLTQQIFTPDKTMSNNDNSTKKYVSPLSMYKFREITPDKSNGFIV